MFLHFPPRKKQRTTQFFLLILISLLISKASPACTEQWKAINLGDKSTWTLIDEVSFADGGGLLFYRDASSKKTSNDIGGAAWSPVNLSNKKGLLISFTPSITIDNDYYGNLKYPQGFAIVFTSSGIQATLKGSKGSGIGYEGINTAVAFEFDFVQQTDKNDIKNPHFSAHYNLNGAVSALSPSKCTVCNKEIPNFYDNSKEGFLKNLKIYIEVFGSLLNVYTSTGVYIVKDQKFTYLEDLLENAEVHVGITAAMNLNKNVLIKDFQIAEIAESGQGTLSGTSTSTGYSAGSDIVVSYTIKSTCGKDLKIYQQQYKNIVLKINDNVKDIKSIAFDSAKMYLTITFDNLTAAGTYSVIIVFNGSYSNVYKLSVSPGTVQRFDLCEATYDKEYKITSELSNDGQYFKFLLCSYDQYKNPKSHTTGYSNLISVEYPKNYIPDSPLVINPNDNANKVFNVQVPISSHGTYAIYSNIFFNNDRRYYTINQAISNTNSQCVISKVNKKANKNEEVFLQVKIKDQFNQEISESTLTSSLGCVFDSSKVKINKNGQESIEQATVVTKDGYINLKYVPTAEGRYTFVPFIKCTGDDNAYEIECDGSGDFYVVSNVIDTTRFKVYSDYYDKSYFNTELTKQNGNYLYLSLEEDNNYKLTSISFVDTSGMDIPLSGISPTDLIEVNIEEQTSNEAIIKGVPNEAGFIDLVIKSSRKEIFDQFSLYTLSIKITSTNYKMTSAVSIPVKFLFKNNLLNNIDFTDTTMKSMIPFSKLQSSSITATESIALYEVYAKGSKAFIPVRNVDKSLFDLTATLDGTAVTLTPQIEAFYGYFLISTSLTKAGTYSITLKYSTQTIASQTLIVNAQLTPTSFSYDESDTRIESKSDTGIIFKSSDLTEKVSFSMKMKDQFGNVIVKDAMDAFGTINVIENGVSASIGFNGVIYINDFATTVDTHTIKFTMPTTNKVFMISIPRTSKIIDPTTSFAKIDYSISSSTVVGNPITVVVTFKDAFRNTLDLSDESVLASANSNVKIYAINKDRSYYDVFLADKNKGGYYLSTLTKADEYSIEVFYNNLPIKCNGCFFNLQAQSASETQTKAFYLDNKILVPLFETEDKAQIINNNNEFHVMIEHRDTYDNKAKSSTIYSMKIENGSTSIALTAETSGKEETKYLYRIGDLPAFKALPEGIYFLTFGNKKFALYLTKDSKSSSTSPSKTKSMLMITKTKIEASADVPASFIIDFRGDDNKRIYDLDLQKVKVFLSDNSQYTTDVFFSSKGVVNAFVYSSITGSFSLSVSYDGNTIISGYTLEVSSGKVSSMTIVNSEASTFNGKSFISLQAKDVKGNKASTDGKLNISKYMFSLKKGNDAIDYETYYNVESGIVTLAIDKRFSGSFSLSSSFLVRTETVTIKPIISSSNNFGIYFEDETINVGSKSKLYVKPYNEGMETISTEEAKDSLLSHMTATLIRTENDNVEFISDFALQNDNNNLYFDISFDKTGDYIVTVHYDSYELSCENCRKVISSSSLYQSITYKTYIKNGANKFVEIHSDIPFMMDKTSLPFIKVNLYDDNNALIYPKSHSFTVKSGATTLESESYVDKNGDVYIYLTKDGKDKYLALTPLSSSLLVEASFSGKTTQIAQISILNAADEIVNTATCAQDALPTLIESTKYIVRADKELVVEFKLTGCESQVKDYQYESFKVNTPSSAWNTKIVPADVKGHYYLFAYSNTAVTDAEITIQFKNSDLSEKIIVTVIPSYSIDTMKIEQEEISSPLDNESRFAYFHITPYDTYKNKISNEHVNAFVNDIFVNVAYGDNTRYPYQITYSPEQNVFVGQVPIKGNGDIVVSSKLSTDKLTIKISHRIDYRHSYVKLAQTNNGYTMTFTLKDSSYQPLTLSDFNYKTSLDYVYESYDLVNGEKFRKILSDEVTCSGNVCTATISHSMVMYHYFSIVPYHDGAPLNCEGCLIKNSDARYFYEVQNTKYSPYNLNKVINIEHSIESPLFALLIVKNKAIDVTSTGFSIANHIFKIDDTHDFVVMGYNTVAMVNQTPSSENATIGIGDLEMISLKLYSTFTTSTNEVDKANINLHGTLSHNYFAGDEVSFYLEARDSENKLTSSAFSIRGSSDSYTTLIRTSVVGIYRLYIPSNTLKSDPEFTIVLTSGDSTEKKVYLNGKAGYPKTLSLRNKIDANWNKIIMTVDSDDENGNKVCDERLNLIITSTDFPEASYEIKSGQTECYINLHLTGSAVISSPINKELALSVTNIDNVGKNALDSRLVVSSSVVHDDSSLTLSFNLKAINGMLIPSTLPIANMKLDVYKYTSPTKRECVQKISGLYDLSYNFLPSQFNMVNGGKYIMVGVIDGKEFKDVVNVKYEPTYSNVPSKFNVKMIVNNEITDVSSKLVLLSERNGNNKLSLSYPYSFEVSVLNAKGVEIPTSAQNLIVTLNVDDTKGDQVFEFSVAKTTETKYEVVINGEKYDEYIHLPKKDYFIKFIDKMNGITYAIQTVFNDGLHQNPNIGYTYALASASLPSVYYLTTESKDTNIYTNDGSFSESVVCFMDASTNGKIYNEYIHVDDLTFTDGSLASCTINKSVKYRGCVNLYVKCNYGEQYSGRLTYQSVPSFNTLTVSVDPAMPPTSVNIKSSFPNSLVDGKDLNAAFTLTNGNKEFKLSDINTYKVYINSQPVNMKSDASVYYGSGGLNIKLYSKAFTYPPTSHEVKVYVAYGNNDLYEITGLNTKVTFSQTGYTKGSLSLPVGYRSGDEFTMYLMLKDKNGYCFNGAISTSDFSFSIKKTGKEDYKNFQINKITIEEFTKCETALMAKAVENTYIAEAGTYIVSAFKSDSTEAYLTATLTVYSGELNEEKSSLQIVGQPQVQVGEMKAGEEVEMRLAGKDLNNNSIDFYDLASHFKLQVLNNDKYTYSVEPNGDELKIKLQIDKIGEYDLELTIKDKKFSVRQGLKKVIVNAGECTNDIPSITIPQTSFYPGEKASINIKCTDKLGNEIVKQGTESFTIQVQGSNLEVVGEVNSIYAPTFTKGIYEAKIILPYTGTYKIAVFLNGQDYGTSNTLEVTSSLCSEESPYMCPDKSCVSDPNDCKINFESPCTFPEQQEKKFYQCKVGGTLKCVTASDLNTCDCQDGYQKCNGMCLPIDYNYCQKEIVTNCVALAQLLFPSATVSKCKDGSCRISGQCPGELVCPIGYIPCGIGCIEYGKTCTVDIPTCKENEVRCWDLSCVTSYDKCPTRQSCHETQKYLCPDGTCVSDVNKCPQPPKCEDDQVRCGDMSCKNHLASCATKPICSPGLSLCSNNECKDMCYKTDECQQIKCPNGQCVSNSQFCPTEMYCPSSYMKCPNGGCAKSLNDCEFIQGTSTLTCPLSTPVLCPDLKCVADSQECTKVPTCPPNAPYQCWNNECRKSLDQCPTQITCPSDSPVLCANGFCQKASSECKNTDTETCSSSNVRCFDGSCASSLSLCPTHSTCGGDLIKCWNGSCVSKVSECPPPPREECSKTDATFRCPDGSCRKNRQSCSTISLCPVERPVKCYDNSCRSDIDACPKYHSCGKNMKSCPDGTCAANYEDCNTIVTCYSSSPFLCYDNTCKNDIRDCPTPPICEGKVLCPNGLCVSNRQNCKFFDACPTENPVRCSTNSCKKTSDECNENQSECPAGYVKCTNGGCKISELYCESYVCPPNKPYKCPEGVCEIDQSYCDNENGCPYSLPVKCSDSSCVASQSDCPTIDEKKCQDQILCPDGSCSDTLEGCPQLNGCSKEKPQRCADGTCINPKSSSCARPQCPFNSPIQCTNGECVGTTADCPASAKPQDYTECEKLGKENHFMCADGRCVKSSEFCRPLYQCDNNYYKCNDGTCRVTSNLCPEAMGCPSTRPYRCSNGNCVESNYHCSSTLCPVDYTKCETTGECLKEMSACPAIPVTKNGCPETTPYKCNDGRCLKNEESCINVNIACDEATPFLCPDGVCKDQASSCSEELTCPQGYSRCANGKCVLGGDCPNSSGCLESQPFRCANGQCVTDPSKCESVTVCDSDKPYVCADGSCVANSKFCQILYPCPENYTRCPNGYCASSSEKCETEIPLCPIASPIKCPSGKCVKTYAECSDSHASPSKACKDGEFYCVRVSKCVSSQIDCVGVDNAKGKSSSGSRRRLQTVIENGCTSENPYSCYDGTCVSDRAKCPILPACKMMEYRCPNGSCQQDKQSCEVNTVECEAGLHKCEDGLCRATCPPFNGCSLEQFQCTNGMCVKDKLECIGYSMCPEPSMPYRCIDGKCVSSPSSCTEIKRLGSVKPLAYTFGLYDKVSLNVAYDSNEREIALLEIPANALTSKKSKVQGLIKIEEVAHSELYNTQYYNNTAEFIYNVSNGIIGSDGIIGFENAILSPVIKISSDDIEDKFTFAGLLDIEYNKYSTGDESFKVSDYCLAKFINDTASEAHWECVVRCTTEEQTQFSISSLGIYAVYLNPLREKTEISTDKTTNFFLDNIKTILIVIGVLIVLSAAVFYIFTRVIRYREKYHANREKITLLHQQRQEYELMTTDVFGQTLGDNILGLVYTKNCFYSVEGRKNEGGQTLEDDVEELQRQCNNVEKQNKRLQENIDQMTEQYKALAFEIDSMKH